MTHPIVFSTLLLTFSLAGCASPSPDDDAARDARMAECQLIEDDDERLECIEQITLPDAQRERTQPVGPVGVNND